MDAHLIGFMFNLLCCIVVNRGDEGQLYIFVREFAGFVMVVI